MCFLKKTMKNSVNRYRMKIFRYLIPLWVGVFVYTILTIGFGAKGISSFNQLELENDKVMANIEHLQNINGELINTRDSLYLNRENFAVYARELGFAAPGENFIRIVGLGSPQKPVSSSGQVISPRAPEYTPEIVFQLLSFFVALTVFISMSAYDFLQYFKDRSLG